MKKSNKISAFYIISSISLLLVLLGGGIYGIYLSIGLNFVKSSVSNITEGVGNGTSNVSYGGSVNFESSMTGVIILSIILIVLAVIDFISLIKQITFFKQFKAVRESKITQKIEKKVKSHGSVVFFAIVIDLLSLGAGIGGIFINIRSFAGNNMSWVLYVIDSLVAVLAVASFVLLIIKLKNKKKFEEQYFNDYDIQQDQLNCKIVDEPFNDKFVNYNKNSNPNKFDIDEMEYNLLKLKNLKSSKMISAEEYEILHNQLIGIDKVKGTTEIQQNNPNLEK